MEKFTSCIPDHSKDKGMQLQLKKNVCLFLKLSSVVNTNIIMNILKLSL